MVVGWIAGLLANALWAVGFIAPYIPMKFANADFVFMRHAFYGAVAIAVILRLQGGGTRLPRGAVPRAMLLGAIGYALAFFFTFLAVQFTGGVVAALIIGLVPVVFAIGANLKSRALPWTPLLVASGLILGGLLALKIGAADSVRADVTSRQSAIGVLCAIAAMCCWGFFIIGNRQERPDALPTAQAKLLWAAWIGVGGLVGSAVIVAPSLATGHSQLPQVLTLVQEDWRPVGLAAFMGLFSVWGATWLWSFSSGVLSRSVLAQIAASETVFGVVFSLAYEHKVPGLATSAGVALIVAGILVTMAAPFVWRTAPRLLPAPD